MQKARAARPAGDPDQRTGTIEEPDGRLGIEERRLRAVSRPELAAVHGTGGTLIRSRCGVISRARIPAPPPSAGLSRPRVQQIVNERR